MQERDVIPQRPTLLLVAASIVVILASLVVVYLMLPHRDSEQRTVPHELSGLEQTPASDNGAEIDYTPQRHRLVSYGWVDQEHGIVRVPIDKAIGDFIEQERR